MPCFLKPPSSPNPWTHCWGVVPRSHSWPAWPRQGASAHPEKHCVLFSGKQWQRCHQESTAKASESATLILNFGVAQAPQALLVPRHDAYRLQHDPILAISWNALLQRNRFTTCTFSFAAPWLLHLWVICRLLCNGLQSNYTN